MSKAQGKKTSNPIAKRLKEARLSAGLSQKRLGILAGIDQFVASPRMNQYEVGKHTPNFSVLERIAKALKTPTSFFYTDDDDLAELIRLFGQLNKNQKNALLKSLKNLVQESS